MTFDLMKYRLLTDLRSLELPIDEVEIFVRPFSKTYYGRYYPTCSDRPPKIYVYPFESDGSVMSYETVLNVVIHEMCHHLQYRKGYNRKFGVMHDAQFWKFYNFYVERAKRLNLYEDREEVAI